MNNIICCHVCLEKDLNKEHSSGFYTPEEVGMVEAKFIFDGVYLCEKHARAKLKKTI